MVHAACNTGSGQLAVRSSVHALTSQCARHSGSRWAVLENVWFSASAFPVQKCLGCSVYPPADSARSTTAARNPPKLMALRLLAAGGGGYRRQDAAQPQLDHSLEAVSCRRHPASKCSSDVLVVISYSLGQACQCGLVSSCCREACAACMHAWCLHDGAPVHDGQNYDSADYFNT